MVRPLRVYPHHELPLQAGVKGRRADDVTAGVQDKPAKHAASVGECDCTCFFLDGVKTELAVLINLGVKVHKTLRQLLHMDWPDLTFCNNLLC